MIKYFKPGVFVLSTIPFVLIVYKIFYNKLGPEPVKEITPSAISEATSSLTAPNEDNVLGLTPSKSHLR